jgi:D-aminopeptidase
MKINGQEVGEMAIDAAVAGVYGVPVIFVAATIRAPGKPNASSQA